MDFNDMGEKAYIFESNDSFVPNPSNRFNQNVTMTHKCTLITRKYRITSTSIFVIKYPSETSFKEKTRNKRQINTRSIKKSSITLPTKKRQKTKNYLL